MVRRRWSLKWRLSVLAALPSLAFSAAAPDAAITLQESVEMALARNHYLRSAAHLESAALGHLTQLARRQATRLNVGAVGSQQTFAAEDRLSAVSYNTARIEAEASKMVVASRYLRHDVRLARAEANQARLDRYQAENDVALLAKSLYWRIQTLQTLRSLTERRLKRFRDTESVARAQFRYGKGTAVDAAWAGVQSALVEDDLASIENDLKLATIEFRDAVLGGDPAPFELAGEEAVSPAAAERLLNESGDLADQIALRKAALEVQKQAERRRFARKRLLPYFNLQAGTYDIDGRIAALSVNDSGTVALRASYPVEYDIPTFYQDNYQVEFRVSYDLYDGLQARADTRVEEARLRAAKASFDGVRAGVAERLAADRARLENALERVRSLDRVVAIAAKNVEAATLRYVNGRFTLGQLIDVEKDHFDAQIKQVQAKFDLNVAAETVRLNLEGNPEP